MPVLESAPRVRARDDTLISHRVARTRHEREAAFRLVYNAYVRAGLCEQNPYELRVTPAQLLPTSGIFIAELRGEVICTASLIKDGRIGLPMESIYGQEIARRRRQGLHLAELSCLADRRRSPSRFLDVLIDLSRLIVQSARRQGVDQLLIAVHPRHARFYQRFMAFEPIGAELAYPSVRGNPAVPLCLDFQRVDRERPKNYDRFFARVFPDAQLQPSEIPVEDQLYFACAAQVAGSYAMLGEASESRKETALDAQSAA